MQKFIVEDSFWNLLPDTEIAILVASGMKRADEISEEDTAEVAKLLDRANRLAEHHLTSDTISQNQVVDVWREAYRKFTTKKGARCSIENLLKRVLKDNPVGHITPTVDISNAIALKYALPFGAEDLDKIQGDLCLRQTEGGDDFLPLGEDGPDPTLPGEVAYIDDLGAVCRSWNWRDGQRTAMNDDSTHAFFIIESVDPSRTADLKAAIDELEELVVRYLGANVDAKGIVTRENPEMTIVA